MIGLYAAGYLLTVFSPEILRYLTLEPYYILRGQVWRIITWIIVPPSSLGIFTIIMLFFYFSIGRTLERTWGAFRFNLYIFSGILFSVLGAFILYGIFASRGRAVSFGSLFSTYYINMSIFLAFAFSYPETTVLLYFFIPVKMKWMGVLYGVMILAEMYAGNWVSRVAIIASLMNFIVYYFLTRRSPRISPAQMRQRAAAYRKTVQKPSPAADQPRHRCAICGRTEKDGDHLVFRYCSQCDGAYEYCQDHLFNHQHRRA